MRRRKLLHNMGGVGIASTLAGCFGLREMRTGGSTDRDELSVAVTTSIYDTGILDELHSLFEERSGADVKAIAGGTGQNLRAGKNGDVDAVMAHAPGLEADFLHSGYGINRRDFAFGDFVVLGPSDDPAGVAKTNTAREAFERIASAETPFLSRGDDSGTHRKERAIWAEADANSSGEWYMETGQGMGDTIIQADRQGGAYLLAVRGTYLNMRDRLELAVLVEGPITDGDPMLDNPYGVIAVNPGVHPSVNYEHAMLYIGFLTGPRGQEIIANYTVNDEQLFFANALSETPNFEQYIPENSTRK